MGGVFTAGGSWGVLGPSTLGPSGPFSLTAFPGGQGHHLPSLVPLVGLSPPPLDACFCLLWSSGLRRVGASQA